MNRDHPLACNWCLMNRSTHARMPWDYTEVAAWYLYRSHKVVLSTPRPHRISALCARSRTISIGRYQQRQRRRLASRSIITIRPCNTNTQDRDRVSLRIRHHRLNRASTMRVCNLNTPRSIAQSLRSTPRWKLCLTRVILCHTGQDRRGIDLVAMGRAV
jgi:hypothetical protein